MTTHAERLEISPALRLQGTVIVPGDKSISHRLAMIGAIAQGTTVIHNFAASQDCQSTLDCLKQLGTPIQRAGGIPFANRPAGRREFGNDGSIVEWDPGGIAICDYGYWGRVAVPAAYETHHRPSTAVRGHSSGTRR